MRYRELTRHPFLLLLLLAPLSTSAAEVGLVAPDFSLKTLHDPGETVELSDYSGKVLYLDYFSVWCAPCRAGFSRLSGLRDVRASRGFEVIGISTDPVIADALRYFADNPVSYPLLVDPRGTTAARFGLRTLPYGVVIDRHGVVRGVFQEDAAGDPARLARLVDELIGEPTDEEGSA